MDPLVPDTANLAGAVQALLVRRNATLEGALTALLGQDLEVLFQASTPEGAVLRLPSGQLVTAQGELPYPEGSRLQVRLLPPAPGELSLRLQIQEVRPPAPPPLLAPLFHGEAQALAAKLEQGAPAIEPLMRLLELLSDTAPPKLPSLDQLRTALQELPETTLDSLGRVLGASGPQALATRLLALLEEARSPGAWQDRILPGDARTPDARTPDARTPDARSVEDLVVRVMDRLRVLGPQMPEAHRDAMAALIRRVLHLGARSTDAGSPPPLEERAKTGTTPPRSEAASARLVPPGLPTILQAHQGSRADLPEAWEAWIRGAVRTLADPSVSPREAPFHALQAKEGTAFFEIPLPWVQAGSLQLWVEEEAPEERRSGGDPSRRVLLGLSFTHLGETRLGLAQGPFGLRIRVWTERPEALEPDQERLREDLATLGKPVDLRIYPLVSGPDGSVPSIRSLAVGSSLRALG